MGIKVGKSIKLLFKIVAGIVGVIIIGLILLMIFFPTEAVKKMAIEQMQKQFNREVKIGDVGLNIFKGIFIKDVKISERPSFKKGTFLSCDGFYFQYDLWKLLQLKFVVKKLTIEKPEIFVKRYMEKKQIVFNFSDMLPPVPKTIPKKAPAPVKAAVVKEKPGAKPLPKVSKYALPIDLQIGKMGLEQAKIVVEDTATPKFKETYKLENVHFIIENIKIYENAPLHIKTGFALSVTEIKENVKTDKDINLEAQIDGNLTLFDKKNLLNPSGLFTLALKNGKFYGIQAYEQLLSQAKDISGDVNKYQESLLDSYTKMKKQIEQNQANLKKAGQLGGKVESASSKAGDLANKVANMDISFIKGALDWKFLSKNFEFSELKTVAKVQDSKVITEDIKVDGKEFRINGNGYTGFDTTVSYLLSLVADKKYNQNEVTKAIANANGELEFPVSVTGTISAMKIQLAKADIVKKIQDRLKEKFMSQLKDKSGNLDDMAKQYMDQYLGKYSEDASKLLDAKKREQALQEAKAQADALMKQKEEELKNKAEAEAKAAADEAKRKAEEEAKKKAEEEAKKKLKQFKF